MSRATKEILFPILRSAVCGYELTAEEREAVRGADVNKLDALAEMHDLSHLLEYGLDKNGFSDGQAKSKVFMAAFMCEQLNYELECLCTELEKAKIPYIPLNVHAPN